MVIYMIGKINIYFTNGILYHHLITIGNNHSPPNHTKLYILF
jgi:hypothetical protein